MAICVQFVKVMNSRFVVVSMVLGLAGGGGVVMMLAADA